MQLSMGVLQSDAGKGRGISDLIGVFEKYKGSSIALYGLGTETEKALAELEDKFHIIGLLDGFCEDGYLYGKRIVSLDACVRAGVQLIIVVARPGSCRAIAKRIGDFCLEHEIALIDIRGKNLCLQNRVTYDFGNIVDGLTKEQLAKCADENDVISFDLFDTLIVRQALFSTDVIELAEYRLHEKGISIKNFTEKRLKYEKVLSKYAAPTLEEIYKYVLEKESTGMTAEEMADFEWSIDYELIVPRQEVVDFLSGLYKKGKKIYIVTDTYYRKSKIIKMLEKCGIYNYTGILVSCEYKTGKTQGLFGELKRMAGEKNCLHIGDDLFADVECAGRAGISSCHIYSSLDLLETTGYLGLQKNCVELPVRMKTGIFVSRMFNSPFQFETEDRILSVKNAFDIGFLFMAPVICDFVIWFRQQIKKYGIKNIFFGARDGYFIKQLYDMLESTDSSSSLECGSIYFMTSRMAAVRAGIEDEDDIKYVAGMKFSGTLKQQLWERFGIDVSESDTEGKTILDFSQQIREQAVIKKKNYQHYISRLRIKDGDVAFFDFVAKGTTQMYISRMIKNHIKGFYFLQLEKEYMQSKNLDIQAFYEAREGDAVYDDYYILETVLTSPESSVLEFDDNGNACFANETRCGADMDCVQKIWEGVREYFCTYLKICPDLESGVDRETDEMILNLIHKITIGDQDFLNLRVEDMFFNRMTDMEDLI